MTSTETDPVARAITALTEVARQTRTCGAGTPSELVGPVDFAEVACHVLTTVAANVGDVETLLAGRPGSWEADLVRQVVTCTTPEDELLAWRSEPVRLRLDVEDLWSDFGLYDMYDADMDTAARHARTIDFHVNSDGDHWVATEEDQAWLATETGRAPGSWTVADLAAAEGVVEHVEAMLEQDLSAYFQAYTDTAALAFAERRTAVAVEVTREDRPAGDRTGPRDSLAEDLHQVARERTPLPMTGLPPDFTAGLPADGVRSSGLSYIARARAITPRPSTRPTAETV